MIGKIEELKNSGKKGGNSRENMTALSVFKKRKAMEKSNENSRS